MCNTGVSLTPVIDGKLYTFEARGLFNGVSVIQDMETMSLWDHLTGVSVHGEMKGKQMGVGNLNQMNVEQALRAYPDIHLAMSDRELRANRWSPMNQDVPGLMPIFTKTIVTEDTRLETMDMGVGVWTETTPRYYSLAGELGNNSVVFDELDGRRLVVFVDPTSGAPVAYYVDAGSGEWKDLALELDDGTVFRDGLAFDSGGKRVHIQMPLQQFTRWYGFSLSFPGCEIYGQGVQ